MPGDPIHQTTFRWVQSIGVEWVVPTEKLTIIEMGFCSWIRFGLIQIIELDKFESGLQTNYENSKMLLNHVKTFRKMRRQVVVDVISRDLGRPVWRHPILVTRLLVAPSLPPKQNGHFLVLIIIFNTLKFLCVMKRSWHKARLLLFTDLNNSNTKLISASENYNGRDIGQNIAFSFSDIGVNFGLVFAKFAMQIHRLIFVWGIAM